MRRQVAGEFLYVLERQIRECDALIATQQRRVEGETRELPPGQPESEEVKKLNAQIRELQQRAEQLGDGGQVEEAQSVLKLVQELEAKKLELITKGTGTTVVKEVDADLIAKVMDGSACESSLLPLTF